MNELPSQPHAIPLVKPDSLVAGRYRVLRVLGQGGMGQVYEVEHAALGRRFALKVLAINPCTDEILRRFHKEARSLAQVASARVAQITDFGHEEGVGPYYVMELVDGDTLEDRLERDGRLSIPEVISISIDLAEGLAEVHAAGVVHRDLKPSNVALCRTGPVRVKLLDFGLAAAADESFLDRITRSQEVVGSLPYMAPERFANDPPNPSVDLYALGVVVFEALTGRLPFEGDSAAMLISKHLHHPPPSISQVAPELGVPAPLEQIVTQLLAKDPQARFSSATAVANALAVAEAEIRGVTIDAAAARTIESTDSSRPTFEDAGAIPGAAAAVAAPAAGAGKTLPSTRPDGTGTLPGSGPPGATPIPATVFTDKSDPLITAPPASGRVAPPPTVWNDGSSPAVNAPPASGRVAPPPTVWNDGSSPAVNAPGPSQAPGPVVSAAHGSSWTAGEPSASPSVATSSVHRSGGLGILKLLLVVGAALFVVVSAASITAYVLVGDGASDRAAPPPPPPPPGLTPQTGIGPGVGAPPVPPAPPSSTAAVTPSVPAVAPASPDAGNATDAAASSQGADAGRSDERAASSSPPRTRPGTAPPRRPPRLPPQAPPRRPSIWDGGIITTPH